MAAEPDHPRALITAIRQDRRRSVRGPVVAVDVGALSGALRRAADVLGASGMIVWVASNDGGTLSPVAAHGFDARLVARIGKSRARKLEPDGPAFRENAARVSPATASCLRPSPWRCAGRRDRWACCRRSCAPDARRTSLRRDSDNLCGTAGHAGLPRAAVARAEPPWPKSAPSVKRSASPIRARTAPSSIDAFR